MIYEKIINLNMASAISPIKKLVGPETFSKMFLQEKLVGALGVAFLGMAVVFLALLLIMLSSKTMSAFLAVKKPSSVASAAPSTAAASVAATAATATAATASASATPAADPALSSTETDELIAVITAAIAGFGERDDIVIQRIRKINDPTPAWGRAGISEVMNNLNR